MKKLLLAIILFPLIIPIHAEILIDAVQKGGSGFRCIEIIEGVERIISGHATERKAIAKCTTEQVKNEAGKFIVKPQGFILIIVSSDAAAQILRIPPSGAPAPPASGEVGFNPTSYQVNEDDGTVTLTVTRTVPSGVCDLFVNTSNGTASSPSRRTWENTSFNWPASRPVTSSRPPFTKPRNRSPICSTSITASSVKRSV